MFYASSPSYAYRPQRLIQAFTTKKERDKFVEEFERFDVRKEYEKDIPKSAKVSRMCVHEPYDWEGLHK